MLFEKRSELHTFLCDVVGMLLYDAGIEQYVPTDLTLTERTSKRVGAATQEAV